MVYSGDNQIVAEIMRSQDISPNETPSSIFLRLYGRIIFLNTNTNDYKTAKIGNNRQHQKRC